MNLLQLVVYMRCVAALVPLLVVYDGKLGDPAPVVAALGDKYAVETATYAGLAGAVQNRLEAHRIPNVLLLPTAARRIPKLTQSRLLAYVNLEEAAGRGNVLVVQEVGQQLEELRQFLAAVGIHTAPKGYSVVDHFSGADGVAIAVQDSPAVRGAELAYSGTAALLGALANVFCAAHAPTTAYVSAVGQRVLEGPATDANVWGAGSQACVAAGFQGGANNNRVGYIGGLGTVGSTVFADLADWTFQQRGVLRIRDASVSASPKSLIHRVGDPVEYNVYIDRLEQGEWVPFDGIAPQLEVVMLDPYWRVNLSLTAPGHFSASLKVPDHHGIYKFLVVHRELPYLYLEAVVPCPVRVLALDEITRLWDITNAWVYIAGSGAVVVGFLGFVSVWLVLG